MDKRLSLYAATSIFLSGITLADPDSDYHPMAWGFGMFGGFGMLLFWGILIFIIVLTVKAVRAGSKESNNARRILDELYARGEIDEEVYEKRKRVLSDFESD